MVRMRFRQDFWSGLLFIALGAGFAFKATSYPLGTAAQMGPGFLPFWLGLGLSGLGTLIAVLAFSPNSSINPVSPINWRALVAISGSVVIFGLTLRSMGLIVSLTLLISAGSLAYRNVRWKAVAGNTVFLLLFSWLVFIKGLQLSVPLWPIWIAP